MPDLEFIGEWSVAGGMTLASFLALLAGAVYLRETWKHRTWLRWGLPLMRAAAVFLLVMILPRAVLTHRWLVGDAVKVLMFVDLSESMSLRDDAMQKDRKLMVARRMGVLQEELFDDDLERAIKLLDTSRENASRLDPKESGLDYHRGVKQFAEQMDEVFAELKKVGPGVWPEAAARRVEFMAEVVRPAERLADTVVGSDPRSVQRQLLSLLSVAARWSDTFRSAWKTHVNAIADVGGEATEAAQQEMSGKTRFRRVENYLFSGEDAIAAKLSDTHRLEIVYLRGREAVPFWAGDPELDRNDRGLPLEFDLKATNAFTDLSGPIRSQTGEAESASNRVAVVLISDGQHNSGNAPIELARLFGQQDTPMFTVGVGMSERPADVAVLGINSQENVSLEGRVRGEVILKDDMRAGIRFPLRIEHEGSVLWSTNVETRAEGVRRIPFDFSVKETAERLAARLPNVKYASQPVKLTAVAGRLSDDKDPSNNEGDFRIAVGTKKPRVLLMDGRPRWEYRYLKNLFVRDDNWEVNTLLAGAGGATRPFPRGKGLGRFPDTQEELNRYDLIIFGDLPYGQFTPQEIIWFVDYVGDRGGGIIFLDGRRERLGIFGPTQIGLLMPVKFKSGFPAFTRTPLKFDVPAVNDLLSPMNLTGDPEMNRALWASLRGPHWVSDVTAKPGSETLASLVYGPNKIPTMVFQRIGSGKTLYIGFDESWRWRFNVGDTYHQRFWNQLANWVMEPPFQVKDEFVAMDTGNLRYDSGERVRIRVRPMKEALRRAPNPVMSLILEQDGERVASIRLTPDEDGSMIYRGETPPLGNGEYEARVRIDGVLDSLIQAQTGFSVGAQGQMETAQLHCNVPLLKELARDSGGRYLPEEEIDSLVDFLAPMSKGNVMEEQISLWNSYWWFVPIILLLGAEWYLRKKAGYV